MKKLTLLLVATLLAGIASAQVKNVAVVETEIDILSGTTTKLTKTDVRQITTELRREAVKNLPRERYNIMTAETVQSQGSAKLEECADENCVITLGSKIGADYIVRGTVRRTRTRFRLSVDIYETENGYLVTSSEAVSSENIEELIDKVAATCAEMYKAFANAQPPAQKPESKPPVVYTITVTANPVNGGTVSRNPNQTYYTSGTKANLMATPASGYAFTGWSGDTTGATDLLTITMNGNKTLTANFRYIQKTYKLTTNVSPLLGGYVTRYPDKESYAVGEEVTVTTTPAVDYVFLGWSGAVSERINRVKVTMDGDKMLTASFYRKLELEPKPGPTAQTPTMGDNKVQETNTRQTYTLTTNVSPQSGGFVYRSPNKETYSVDEEVTVMATPASGYVFTGWTRNRWNGTDWTNEVLSEKNRIITVTMDGDKTVTANFYRQSVQAATRYTQKETNARQTVGSGERRPMTGFSFGLNFLDDGEGSHWAFQIGMIRSSPITEETLSFNVEGNIQIGHARYIDRAFYAKSEEESFNFCGVNVPASVLLQLNFFSIEVGAHVDMLLSGDETLFNVGAVVGAGVGFGKERSRRYFYRYSGGYNYGTHVVGMWWLF
jgi:uncharacterized repeat protein (TIGR02543 family)